MTTVHLLQAFPDVAEHYRRGSVTSWSTSTRTPTMPSTCWCANWWAPPATAQAPAELCVVGDADQAIYAFRGATIRNILEFEEDYPDATTILLEQNYRSTQTILTAANAVIARNADRRAKNLWTDAGPRRADRRLRRGQRARRGAVRRRRGRPAHRQGRGQGGRRRGLLPHQRAVPRLRGDLHPGRPALHGRRRRPLLRAQGSQGRPRLPARAVQRRRHRLAAPHPQRAQARHRRPRRSHDRRASLREKITFAAGAAPRRRGVRHGRPLGQRRQALQRR